MVTKIKDEKILNKDLDISVSSNAKEVEYSVCLHKKEAHTLLKFRDGKWELDGKEIPEEQAIAELIEAVQDLGYWCQVAKDVLPPEQFEAVQESYEYHDE